MALRITELIFTTAMVGLVLTNWKQFVAVVGGLSSAYESGVKGLQVHG